MSAIGDDAQAEAVAKGVLPAYFADFWGNEQQYGPLRDAIRATYISGLEQDLVPDTVDDRAALPGLRVPALVVMGRHDVICGVRWGTELSS